MMKRVFVVAILCFAGMTVFAQGTDMSFFTTEFRRPDSTFSELLEVLETVQDVGTTGIGEFWHNCLSHFIRRIPDARSVADQNTAERIAVLLCQRLGAERHAEAAGELWQIAEIYDISRTNNEAHAMSAAIMALGQVGGTDFIPHIILRLDHFNAQSITNAETRRRVQQVVMACVNALEAFQDISGFRPVFFASIGSFDLHTRTVAQSALLNISSDPSGPIIEIIRDPANDPRVKLAAWREMLRADAPNPSRANVAAAALAVSFSYNTNNRAFLSNLGEMRKGAIEYIGRFGAADESVYVNLQRTYAINFSNNNPDYEEISLTLNALAALGTDEASEILLGFLRELHGRRRSGPWGRRERQVYEWVVASIGASGTRSAEMRLLLTTISRTEAYTNQERGMARDALARLGS